MNAFRIMSGGRPVGTIIAASKDDAVSAFVAGRRLPAGCEVSAYSIRSYETRRPRAAKGYR